MPKFKKEEFVISTGNDRARLQPEEKQCIRFTTDIMINASGTFYIRVPDDIAQRCKESDITLHTFYVNRKNIIENTIASETYDNLLTAVVRTLKPLVEFEVESEEIVIRYSFGGEVSYTVADDGEKRYVEYNGNRRDGRPWAWADTPYSNWNHLYSVSIGVEVYTKKVIKYPDGKSKTVYNRLTHADKNKNPELHDLLRIVKIKVGNNYNEIPYTEQSAKALNVGVTGIIQLYDSLQKFNHVETFLEYSNSNEIIKLLSNE